MSRDDEINNPAEDRAARARVNQDDDSLGFPAVDHPVRAALSPLGPSEDSRIATPPPFHTGGVVDEPGPMRAEVWANKDPPVKAGILAGLDEAGRKEIGTSIRAMKRGDLLERLQTAIGGAHIRGDLELVDLLSDAHREIAHG